METEEPEDTAVVAQKEIRNARGWIAMFLSFVVGLAAAVAPGYYALKQSKLENDVAHAQLKKEATTGYETLANPLEQFRTAISILDWRLQRLEAEQGSRQSTTPITPQPLVQPALGKAVPQTLTEANAAPAPATKD